MSYGFSIRAASKDEAGTKVEEQLSQVMASQPIHECDRQVAQDAAEKLVGLLADPGEGECITVYVTGSLGWRGVGDDLKFTSANVTVNASITPIPKE